MPIRMPIRISLSRIGYSTAACIFLLTPIGRVRQQFWSCLLSCGLSAIWASISAPTAHTSTAGLTVIFAISQFVPCAGPNATTFLILTKVFPTRVCGSAHGISAAAGMCGAIRTSFTFGTLENAISLSGILGLFSAIMPLTVLVALRGRVWLGSKDI